MKLGINNSLQQLNCTCNERTDQWPICKSLLNTYY